MRYLQIPAIRDKFDCCHLAALYLRTELNIDTADWDAVPRVYGLSEEGRRMHEELLKHSMVDVDNSFYKKGDIIVYMHSSQRVSVATCIDDKVALVLNNLSTAIHIERIKNKLYHMRHKQLL